MPVVCWINHPAACSSRMLILQQPQQHFQWPTWSTHKATPNGQPALTLAQANLLKNPPIPHRQNPRKKSQLRKNAKRRPQPEARIGKQRVAVAQLCLGEVVGGVGVEELRVEALIQQVRFITLHWILSVKPVLRPMKPPLIQTLYVHIFFGKIACNV